jgi:hypothetical protein
MTVLYKVSRLIPLIPLAHLRGHFSLGSEKPSELTRSGVNTETYVIREPQAAWQIEAIEAEATLES